MKEHSISANAGERDDGRNGDFEAQKRDKLFNGFGEDLVGTVGNPERAIGQSWKFARSEDMKASSAYQKRAQSTQAVFNQSDEWKKRVSMSTTRGAQGRARCGSGSMTGASAGSATACVPRGLGESRSNKVGEA